MQRPHARVIRINLHDNISRLSGTRCIGQNMDIPSLGITRINDRSIPGSRSFGEDVHVMTVHVHGVASCLRVVVDDEADRVGLVEVEDVVFGGELVVADFGVQEDGIVVVDAESGVVYEEEVVSWEGRGVSLSFM